MYISQIDRSEIKKRMINFCNTKGLLNTKLYGKRALLSLKIFATYHHHHHYIIKSLSLLYTYILTNVIQITTGQHFPEYKAKGVNVNLEKGLLIKLDCSF